MPVSTLPEGGTDAPVRDTAEMPERDFNAAFGEMTHAVLNALNAVAAAAELSRLLLRRQEAAEAAKTLARVEPECLRAARLLREGRAFMTFRLPTAGAPVDVVGLLNACAERFADRVEVVAGSERPMVVGDGGALDRLFMELLGNAFAFGASHVRVTPEPADGVLRIGFLDDGPGISAPAVRIFAPFFTTQPDKHSGLGLALAARIAEAHGGRVGLSEPEGGALFWVELPLRRV